MLRLLKKLFRKAPPVPHLPARPNLKACCLVEENRVLIMEKNVPQPDGRLTPVEQRQCKICGCNHYRMFAGRTFEPGKFKIG